MNERPEKKIPERMVQVIRETGNAVIVTHSHPDGDALGSLFGFATILDGLGKRAFCLLEEPVSHLYDFLPECWRASTSLEECRNFVAEAGGDIVVVALDCGDEDRLGKTRQKFLELEPLLVIDHHRSHRRFGTISWVDPYRSSTGEMVYELALALEAPISYACAYNLYVAICTDTGSFRYECTRPRTMHIAAELLAKGIRPEEVSTHLYDNSSKERLNLMQMVLSSLTLYESGQIAVMHVSEEMLAESGATMQDVEGFIDLPRSLRSVKVAVLVKEASKGTVAVSLRAKGDCDVSQIAKQFDGGGHRNAAGFRCHGKTREQVSHELRLVLSRALN
jgi:phosphoesterase RecJ-like protein